MTDHPSWSDPLAWLCHESNRARLLAVVVAGVVTVGLSGLLLVLGMPYIGNAPWTDGVLTDGAWRLHQGQVAHRDFTCPIGFMYVQLGSWAISLFGPSWQTPAFAAALAFPLVVIPGALVMARRLPPWPAVWFGTIAAVLTVSLSPFGYAPTQFTYSGGYNRICWGMFAVVLFQALVPARERSDTAGRNWLAIVEHVLIGGLVAMLFGIKFVYALAATIIWIAGAVLDRQQRTPATITGRLAGFVVGLIAISLIGDIPAYLSDIGKVIASNDSSLISKGIKRLISIDAFVGALTIAVVLGSWFGSPAAERRRALGAVLIAGVMAFGLTLTNGKENLSPAHLLGAMVAVGWLVRHRAVGVPWRWALTPALLVILAWSWNLSRPFLAGWTWSRGTPVTLSEHSPIFNQARMRPRFDPHYQPGPLYTPMNHYGLEGRAIALGSWSGSLGDGIDLLASHVPANSKVISLDYVNPFPFAMQWPAPVGDAILWHFGWTMSAEAAPSPTRLLADVDIVLRPKLTILDATVTAKWELYGPAIEQDFEEVANSDWWIVYRRRITAP